MSNVFQQPGAAPTKNDIAEALTVLLEHEGSAIDRPEIARRMAGLVNDLYEPFRERSEGDREALRSILVALRAADLDSTSTEEDAVAAIRTLKKIMILAADHSLETVAGTCGQLITDPPNRRG